MPCTYLHNQRVLIIVICTKILFAYSISFVILSISFIKLKRYVWLGYSYVIMLNMSQYDTSESTLKARVMKSVYVGERK